MVDFSLGIYAFPSFIFRATSHIGYRQFNNEFRNIKCSQPYIYETKRIFGTIYGIKLSYLLTQKHQNQDSQRGSQYHHLSIHPSNYQDNKGFYLFFSTMSLWYFLSTLTCASYCPWPLEDTTHNRVTS